MPVDSLPKLSPCPFCGATAELKQVHCEHNHNYYRDGNWFIKVEHKDNCILRYTDFARNGFYDGIKGEYEAPSEDVYEMCEKWNTRVKLEE